MNDTNNQVERVEALETKKILPSKRKENEMYMTSLLQTINNARKEHYKSIEWTQEKVDAIEEFAARVAQATNNRVPVWETYDYIKAKVASWKWRRGPEFDWDFKISYDLVDRDFVFGYVDYNWRGIQLYLADGKESVSDVNETRYSR